MEEKMEGGGEKEKELEYKNKEFFSPLFLRLFCVFLLLVLL